MQKKLRFTIKIRFNKSFNKLKRSRYSKSSTVVGSAGFDHPRLELNDCH